MPRLPNRSRSHGPTSKDTLLPAANRAMVNAPSSASPLSAATSSAEYSSPHGMKAHIAPITSGAAEPQLPWNDRMRIQTRRAVCSSQTG